MSSKSHESNSQAEYSVDQTAPNSESDFQHAKSAAPIAGGESVHEHVGQDEAQPQHGV